MHHLQEVFDRLREHGLKLKLKQCSFLKLETNYLGFLINDRGINPDPLKIEGIKSLPAPTCVREAIIDRYDLVLLLVHSQFLGNCETCHCLDA